MSSELYVPSDLTSMKYHAMKTYGELELQFQTFVTYEKILRLGYDAV
jgi:hypothetical protein